MSYGFGRVAIQVEPDSELHGEDLELLTRQLRQELAELKLVSVGMIRTGPGSPRVRATDNLAVTGLVVSFADGAALSAVVAAVLAWLVGRRRWVRLDVNDDVLEVSGASLDDQRRRVDRWIARHGAAAA
ncbi:MAG TPA: hypothetical protein VGJ63_22555 [Micromonosporaceae bacterium]|jgi:hypothetical protein